MSMTLLLILLCAMLFMAVAVTTDLMTRKIPNALNVPVFAVALVYYTVAGAIHGGWKGALLWFGFSFAGFAIAFGIIWIMWMFGGAGGGDVKMMGALGAWLGPALTVYVLFAGTIIAAALTLCILVYSGITRGFAGTKRKYVNKADAKKIRKKGETTEEAQQRAKTGRRLMPFGLPMALATTVALAAYFANSELVLKLWSWTQ